MITFKEYEQAANIVEIYLTQGVRGFGKDGKVSKFVNINLNTKILSTNISGRLVNILLGIGVNVYDTEIHELQNVSVSEFQRFGRGVGVGMFEELIDLCFQAGVKLRP